MKIKVHNKDGSITELDGHSEEYIKRIEEVCAKNDLRVEKSDTPDI